MLPLWSERKPWATIPVPSRKGVVEKAVFLLGRAAAKSLPGPSTDRRKIATGKRGRNTEKSIYPRPRFTGSA